MSVHSRPLHVRRGPVLPTRDDIVHAALEVIHERGIEGATTREIARVAGCSEGSIYNHFDDKETLLLEATRSVAPEFVLHARALAGRVGEGTVEATLHETMRLALEFYERVVPTVAVTLGDEERRRKHREMLERDGRGPLVLIDAIAAYVAGEQELGRIHGDADPRTVAMTLIGSALNHALLRFGLGDDAVPYTPRTFARRFVSTLLAGLAPKGT